LTNGHVEYDYYDEDPDQMDHKEFEDSFVSRRGEEMIVDEEQEM
jgi:hypothetical protein